MTTMSEEEINKLLQELTEVHSPQEVEEMGFADLPDANYQARLDKIYIEKARSSGRTQMVMEFEVLSGEYKGRSIKKWCGMETPENLDFLTRDLWVLGVPKNFKWIEVEKYFPDLLDKTFDIQVKRTDKYINKYIQRQIKVDANASTPDDDFPF